MDREQINRLKELAQKATQGPWDTGASRHDPSWVVCRETGFQIADCQIRVNGYNNAAFISAANPAVVLALVERIERLEEDFEVAARSAAEESVKAARLEEEADWLAEYSARDECPLETLGWDKNPEDRPQWCDWHYDVNDNVYGSDCSGGCAECWRKAAQDAIAEEEARIKESDPDA